MALRKNKKEVNKVFNNITISLASPEDILANQVER